MVSEGVRSIASGLEYDSLFPAPGGEDKSVKGNASVEDTMKLICKTVPLTLWHTDKIAKRLKGKDLYATCRNIWNFVYRHIRYKRDKDGVEQVRSPRRTWGERQTGVDCDCYTEFISSILYNLQIPHVARITKYPKQAPEVPQWQHVYPIVPKSGNPKDVENRAEYIVLDCVKNKFDDEQPYLEKKDYEMKLEYLDGFDDEDTDETEVVYQYENDAGYDYETVEAQDIAALYGELGFLKKLVKKVSSAVKKVGTAVKTTAKKVGTVVQKAAKVVSDKVGDGIRLINRFVNPVTILLRNGFLLIMKLNMFNIGGRLRYAYLSDEQAKAMNMNLENLKKLRSIKDRAETVYWQAGGKKDNLKKAILSGKGNKDKKVQLQGLFGIDDVYMDMDEYNIIHADPDNLEGLGEIASGTAIAAATSAAAAIAAALKQIKGLFNKGGAEEAAFQSETDNAGTSTNMSIPEDEDALTVMEEYYAPATTTTAYNTTIPAQSTIPTSAVARRSEDIDTSAPGAALPAAASNTSTKGFLDKTTTWVKENPGKTLLIAGAVAGGGYLLVKSIKQNKRNNNGLNGFPRRRKKRKKKSANKRNAYKRIQSITL